MNSTSDIGSKSLQSSDLVAAAASIAAAISERTAEIERNGFLPADISEQLGAAGFFRLLAPKVYGGLEAHPMTFVDVVERIARVDGSAAWCVFIGATAGASAAYLPAEQARAMFARPNALSAGVFAPRGKAVRETLDGVPGYRVTGRWQWGSGSRNADYIFGGCLILDDEGKPEKLDSGIPLVQSMVFDAKDVTLLDTWQVSGLCGTGSTDFEVKDVFVPRSHSFSYLTDKPVDGPLYCFPVFGLLGIGIAAVSLGLARGAIDELIDLAGAKKPDASSRVLAQRPSTQIKVAEAEALVRSARAYLAETINAAWDAAADTGSITTAHRCDIRLATTHAVRAAAQAVDLMYGLGGGTSVYRTSPLQRYFRDVHVATQHMMVSESTLEVAGRLFLGLPTEVAML